MPRVQFLCENVYREFNSRAVIENRRKGIPQGVMLDVERGPKTLLFKFTKADGSETHTIDIPLPYMENGVVLIERNGVQRAICNYFVKNGDLVLEYLAIIYRILCDDPTGIIPSYMIKKVSFLQQIINGFARDNAEVMVHNLQRAINEVINKMPLHETNMNSWAMNRRLIIIDSDFDQIRSPKEKLEYQVQKNKDYFSRGWTSMGLSDGVLADKNYILTEDLRKFTPFGNKFHNPQRNLYSTLGMKGDDLPFIRSESAQKLIDEGITRKGWNLFTVFADIPDVWEDQLMVDESHANKLIEQDKRYQCFGTVLVEVGEVLKRGQALSESDDETRVSVNIEADKLIVRKIEKTTVNIGGKATVAYNIIVAHQRKLKDGVKITNTAANKGVIRLAKLGYSIDPRTGQFRKIDVIVSCKAVRKRKNYSQILEALSNNVNGEKVTVIADDATPTIEHIEDRLEQAGFNRDGTWECHTYAGKFKAVAGCVFWGVTHAAEDTVWDLSDTTRKNNRDLRTAGLKFSTVEFRAITTRFGYENPIIDEILSYTQGTEDLHEQINVLRSKIGSIPKDADIIPVQNIKPVDQSESTIIPKILLDGTIADEIKYPKAFVLQLPITYEVAVDPKDWSIRTEGIPQTAVDGDSKVVRFDKIYVPSASMRRPWKHITGNYGLSEVGTLLNNIVDISHRFLADTQNADNYRLLYMAVSTYFKRISFMMGTKRGEIATYGMSVRYPFSTKAVATLSNNIPKNTVEIHSSMASVLNVFEGDIVLVERFPCLGFMSVRPQKVHITKDPRCKYTIRSSGNSLKSTNLDYDGDVIYLASFHSPKAKELLKKEWTNPNKTCYRSIQSLNEKMGKPRFKFMDLKDYEVSSFPALTSEMHAEFVRSVTGVKSHTGPVVALAYNLMRIVENSDISKDHKINVAVEMFLDKVGNSVFAQKHGTKSLHDIVIDAICAGDVEALVSEGFSRGITTIICSLVAEKATTLGVHNLAIYHEKAVKNGWSNIINRIVREQNKIYFATRSRLEGCELLFHLNQPAVDMPSRLLQRILSGKPAVPTCLDKHLEEKKLKAFNTPKMREVYKTLCTYIDDLMVPATKKVKVDKMRQSYEAIIKNKKGGHICQQICTLKTGCLG